MQICWVFNLPLRRSSSCLLKRLLNEEKKVARLAQFESYLLNVSSNRRTATFIHFHHENPMQNHHRSLHMVDSARCLPLLFFIHFFFATNNNIISTWLSLELLRAMLGRFHWWTRRRRRWSGQEEEMKYEKIGLEWGTKKKSILDTRRCFFLAHGRHVVDLHCKLLLSASAAATRSFKRVIY